MIIDSKIIKDIKVTKLEENSLGTKIKLNSSSTPIPLRNLFNSLRDYWVEDLELAIKNKQDFSINEEGFSFVNESQGNQVIVNDFNTAITLQEEDFVELVQRILVVYKSQ